MTRQAKLQHDKQAREVDWQPSESPLRQALIVRWCSPVMFGCQNRVEVKPGMANVSLVEIWNLITQGISEKWASL